ncbi:L,D-transpeptidase family protein [Tardiphaga sp.]|uniref:L,D-transpeptidase family protein n=1 Tax=Tardiphaga sp. TaxID=1926292 RepID=UPI00262A5DD0|nr:L,D-transpeptidase family protein [Tardiphaga sp.]MDB5616152.1 murein L,D-transpeptidase [Tardiphaga sp.]
MKRSLVLMCALLAPAGIEAAPGQVISGAPLAPLVTPAPAPAPQPSPAAAAKVTSPAIPSAPAPADKAAAAPVTAAPQTRAAPAKAAATAPAATPESRSAALLAQSGEPTFDAGSAQRLADAIDAYSTIAKLGGWPQIPVEAKFALGSAGEHDATLRLRLVMTGDLASSEAKGPYNAALVSGVKRFQARHGLATTGAIGPRTLTALNVPVEKRIQQLEASLQRIATIGFHFGQRYVVVNLPAAFAEAVENDKVVRRYRVVLGKADKPSPTVTSEISNINLNPTWTVPASITKNEIAAHMRKDPTYLSRLHMQVLDFKENVLDPASVDWAAEKLPNIFVRQEPGSWNALGQVKIDMPNAYAVYMHDTNQKNLFSEDDRFDSHGCVRVDNVRDLAAWLLQETPNWERAKIDEAIATGQRQSLKLEKKVPVAWIYLTAWMTRDQIVQFRSDVYDQDAQLVEATSEEKAFFDQAVKSRTN